MNYNGRSAFPDDAYPCAPELRADYVENVAAGRGRMLDATVVICGLTRDVEDHLPVMIERIERIGRMFRDYRVVVYENDSADETLPMLRAWEARNPWVLAVSEQLDKPKWPSIRDDNRGDDMAYYRNKYVEAVLERHADFDHMIVLDTDVTGGFSYEGVASTFGHDGWDAVGSCGIQHRPLLDHDDFPAYYDVWAFRDVNHPEPHANLEVAPRLFQRGQPLVPVWSSFGGLAVYRMEPFRAGCRYAGGDCEHVPLHLQMRERGFGSLYMNPSQIVVYPPKLPCEC